MSAPAKLTQADQPRITQTQLLALQQVLAIETALKLSQWHTIVCCSLKLATVALRGISANRRAHRD